MRRTTLLVVVSAIVVLATQFTNEAQQIAPLGEELIPAQQQSVEPAPVPSLLEPLVFIPEDCDLDDNGKVDEADLLAAQNRTPAFLNFRDRVMEQACQSAKRLEKTLLRGEQPEFDCLARLIIRMHVPKQGMPKDRGPYRVLTHWDATGGHDCSVQYDSIDEETFEQIQKGELYYYINPRNGSWKRVHVQSKPVIIRRKPAAPKAPDAG